MPTLQFFHQYLFFSLAAQLSNWEAPAWRASALSSSSESFWSLSKTLSTFTRMMSTTWREGGRKSRHERMKRMKRKRCSVFVSEMNGWLMRLLAREHPGRVYLFHLGLRLLKPAVAGGIGRGWRCTAGTICTRSSGSSGGSSWGRIWCRPSRKLTSKLNTGI